MNVRSTCSQKGITLIELLMAFVIGGIIIGGIYRLFVAQTKAYTVQDQVAEVQQNVRSGMEILLRDLRMTGFDNDSDPRFVHPPAPWGKRDAYTVNSNGDNSITVNYKYFDTITLRYQRHSVAYWIDDSTPDNQKLIRQITIDDVASPQEILLEKVRLLPGIRLFTYGVDPPIIDTDGDGVPDKSDGIVNNWVFGTPGLSNVVAIRVRLTGGPEQVDPQDKRFEGLRPRAFDSIVTLRNSCLAK